MTVYRFWVGWSADKDALLSGEVVSGYSHVEVEADDSVDARLTAEQIVACRHEPTEVHGG